MADMTVCIKSTINDIIKVLSAMTGCTKVLLVLYMKLFIKVLFFVYMTSCINVLLIVYDGLCIKVL